MKENYKDIVSYEDLYEVSDTGLVRNKVSGKILKPGRNNGYLYVNLCKNGKYKSIRIHRLVAEAFIPNPLNLPEIDHIDKNRSNNNVDNLRWVNHQENIDYSKSKPVCQYALDGRLLNTYKSAVDAARQTGINRQSINNCCLGRTGYKSAGNFIWKFKQ